jgi:branched-chain amino acid transport system substrate-binding protein
MTLKSETPANYWSSFHWYPEAHRGNKISDALEAAIKEKTKETYLSGYHSPAHSGILAFANGIKRADGKTDSESVMKAMEGMTFDMSKGKATFRKEDHQAIVNVDYVRFDPDPGSSQGWKVTDFKSIEGADLLEPPSPGKPVTYQYFKKT